MVENGQRTVFAVAKFEDLATAELAFVQTADAQSVPAVAKWGFARAEMLGAECDGRRYREKKRNGIG